MTYSQALLYFKGYHAIQLYRFSHELWAAGRKAMALSLQSRLSEVLAVDIHPAARFGKGILLDHGTGLVIGETAVIGNGVSLMQARSCCCRCFFFFVLNGPVGFCTDARVSHQSSAQSPAGSKRCTLAQLQHLRCAAAAAVHNTRGAACRT